MTTEKSFDGKILNDWNEKQTWSNRFSNITKSLNFNKYLSLFEKLLHTSGIWSDTYL